MTAVKTRFQQLTFYLFIFVFVVSVLFPFYWQLKTSLKPESDVTNMSLLPNYKILTLDAYKFIFVNRPFAVYILNSFMVSLITTALCVSLASLAGYAIARLNFRGKSLILTMILSVSLFPAISVLSPMYMIISSLGLRNSWIGLVIPYTTFALPLSVWYLSTFFKTIPFDLEFAAQIDGCTKMQAFAKVILPLTVPGTFTTAILIFIMSWNEYLFSLTINTRDLARTIPVGITMFRGEFDIPWVQTAAAIITVTVPLACIVLLLQRRIIAGLVAGATKE